MERLTIVLQRYLLTVGNKESGFVQLFVSKRLIHGAATALLGVFVPIFIYTTVGEKFYVVGLLYALFSLGYVVLLIPGMKITNKLGFSHTLVLGSFMSVCVYIVLYFMNEANIYTLLPIFAAFVILFRVFHWVPYHVDFTKFTHSGERGRDVSLTFATIAFLGVIGPLLAGFIITNAGYDVLFMVAIILLVIATISYGFVPEVKEKFEWGFGETLSNLFSKQYRHIAFGEFANGAEVVVTLIAWPIFLYEILEGNVLEIGAVSTIIVAFTIVIQLLLGKYLDRGNGNKEKTLKVGSLLYAIGWIVKIFVLSTVQVFFVGLYHNITKIFTKTPYSAILYDMSADQGSYVDEFTVLREIASHTGRVVALVAITGLALIVSIKWAFLIGAVSALLLNMVYRVAHDD